MTFEQRGQYCFNSDQQGNLRPQKNPLGIKFPSMGERIKMAANNLKELVTNPRPQPALVNLLREPINNQEMNLLGDLLLSDLRKKGMLEIVARETNTDPSFWYNHGKNEGSINPAYSPEVWDVDVIYPDFHYSTSPSGHSRWSEQGCVRVSTIPDYNLTLLLSLGEEWDERIVTLSYDRHQKIQITAGENSKIDLSLEGSKYLFQEHLRDAMKNPYNPYWQTKDGFLSPRAMQKHLHEISQKQEVATAA